MMMKNIDIQKSKEQVESALCNLTELMIFYELPKLKLHEITEDTKFDELLVIKNSTSYDSQVKKILHLISLLDAEEKRVVYCVHILKISRRKLRSDQFPFEYSFGDPYKLYQLALVAIAYMSKDLIVYKDEKE